jgi:RimJ/RimL family protein N-acetyltransferase
MASQIPDRTISVFARSIFQEARNYGFSQIDTVRLINALMDLSVAPTRAPGERPGRSSAAPITSVDDEHLRVEQFPLASPRLRIRLATGRADRELLDQWLQDQRGQQFLLSCATARHIDLDALLESASHHVGIVTLLAGDPIGVVAFLDHDRTQQRAELRKLIAVPAARGHGYAREATVLWLKYGIDRLGLEKISLSTLQNQLRNIRVNESVGFRVEGVLADEVLIDGQRMDVLRMGFSRCRRRREGN